LRRTLANGVALEVIAREPAPVADRPEEKLDEIARGKRRAKTSTLVLVSAASADVALATPAAQTGGGQAAAATPIRPAPGARPKSGGGGGTEGGGAGAGQPPRDRIFNQDDLMGVLIVLTVLLLLALYFFRGGGGAPADEGILNTQSAATEPVAEPLAPPPDPFGNRAVDLTPRSPPPPVESAIVAATPPPPQADTSVRTYFCTASSQLTPAARDALEKHVADWGVDAAGGLVVSGYADTRGSTESNRALGGARASAVADFLRSRNFTVVELSGIGELEGLADNENCANQRRVDIRLARGTAEPPSRSCAPPPEAADLACG
jgi:outer membrane protein OmpA-like peptidoglycan-associated protein